MGKELDYNPIYPPGGCHGGVLFPSPRFVGDHQTVTTEHLLFDAAVCRGYGRLPNEVLQPPVLGCLVTKHT